MPEARSRSASLERIGRVGVALLVFAALWGLWEAYRWTWMRFGLSKTFVVDETTMPHLHDIVGALGERTQTNGPLLIDYLSQTP